MRFKVFEIARHKGYLIHIGSRQITGKQFKREVQEKIDTAMSTFERTQESRHSISITRDSDTMSGDSDLPELQCGKQYLIFALSFSAEEPFDNMSRRELKEGEKNLGQSLDRLFENMTPKPKISLVVLNDCTVELLSIDANSNYKSWLEGQVSSGKRTEGISLEEFRRRADRAFWLEQSHNTFRIEGI